MLKIRWLAALIFGLAIHNAIASPFEYSNLLDGRPFISIQTDPPMITSGDRATNAVFCKNGEKFICFNSDWINFSFPHEQSSIPSEWTKDGVIFKLKASAVIRVFGVCRDAYKVVSNQNGREFEFLYSVSHGLLGFNAEIDGQRVTYIAQRQMGFGAANAVNTPSSQNHKQQRESSKNGNRLPAKCPPP